MMTRREFLESTAIAGLSALAGCRAFVSDADGAYAVAILGDTHFDAEPESVYHSHYDETNRWAKIQHAEFRRNGEMWRLRCHRLLGASAKLSHARPTDFVLQVGDLIQGDCDDAETHKKMLSDCLTALRAPYPKGLPFLTVVGNHDFRGKGARQAYFQFMEPYLTRELGMEVHYPAFSFRHGRDRWIFCDFESRDLEPIIRLVEADEKARHVFLVTHGPFSCPDNHNWTWRLGGDPKCEQARRRLYEALSRRHAVVLSGHTHTLAYYRHENEFGGFSEFTCNSVWMADALATAEPIVEGTNGYGGCAMSQLKEPRRAEYRRDLDLFRSGLKDYFFNNGAGHFRLNVADSGVQIELFPGDATIAARSFRLK